MTLQKYDVITDQEHDYGIVVKTNVSEKEVWCLWFKDVEFKKPLLGDEWNKYDCLLFQDIKYLKLVTQFKSSKWEHKMKILRIINKNDGNLKFIIPRWKL